MDGVVNQEGRGVEAQSEMGTHADVHARGQTGQENVPFVFRQNRPEPFVFDV